MNIINQLTVLVLIPVQGMGNAVNVLLTTHGVVNFLHAFSVNRQKKLMIAVFRPYVKIDRNNDYLNDYLPLNSKH